MKHVTLADKSLLIGDEAADALVDYGTLIARLGTGDRVDLNALTVDGSTTLVSFLLNPGVTLLAETTNSPLPEPDNADAIEYMRKRIADYDPSTAAEDSAESVFGQKD